MAATKLYHAPITTLVASLHSRSAELKECPVREKNKKSEVLMLVKLVKEYLASVLLLTTAQLTVDLQL